MKKCLDCEEVKPKESFSWRNKSKGKLQSYCKLCMKVRNATHYAANKQQYKKSAVSLKRRNKLFVWEYLIGHPCVDCGEDDPVVLEFDHVSGQKHLEVSKLADSSYSISTIEKEILKCEVRCANCHKRKTAKQLNYWYVSTS